MGSALVKEEPEEELPAAATMPAPPSAPGAAPPAAAQGTDDGVLVAAIEGAEAAAASGSREAAAAAAPAPGGTQNVAVVPAPAPQEQQLSLSNTLLLDIKNALLDVKEDMGACKADQQSTALVWLGALPKAMHRNSCWRPAAPGQPCTHSPHQALNPSLLLPTLLQTGRRRMR